MIEQEEIDKIREAAYAQGVLDARRALAAAWCSVTEETVHATDFTVDYLRNRLDARFLRRRTLADGAVPVVGLRVVTIHEIAERWGLSHAHREDVHEITSVLEWAHCGLVECGPTQFGVGMLRVAPAGADVTCSGCRGWHERMAISRAVSELRTEKDADIRALQSELSHQRSVYLANLRMLHRMATNRDRFAPEIVEEVADQLQAAIDEMEQLAAEGNS